MFDPGVAFYCHHPTGSGVRHGRISVIPHTSVAVVQVNFLLTVMSEVDPKNG